MCEPFEDLYRELPENGWPGSVEGREVPEPWTFTPNDDGTLSLESAVFQALGGASACWSDLSGAGVFESERAEAIGEEFLSYLNGKHTLASGAFVSAASAKKFVETLKEGSMEVGGYLYDDRAVIEEELNVQRSGPN